MKVRVNHDQVEGASDRVFKELEKQITEFFNHRHWTSQQYARVERIKVNFNLTVNRYDPSSHHFDCRLQVQASRPVYGASYTSVLFAFQDEKCAFDYEEFTPLEFRIDAIDNNLTAVLAYYAYLIIGLDNDGMSLLGGSDALGQARMIAVNAQSLGAIGWESFGDDRNRYAFIHELLNPELEGMRRAFYVYYRKGLDVMSANADRGRHSIGEALEEVYGVYESHGMAYLPVWFVDVKSDEIVSVFRKKGTAEERETLREELSAMNPSKNSLWNEL